MTEPALRERRALPPLILPAWVGLILVIAAFAAAWTVFPQSPPRATLAPDPAPRLIGAGLLALLGIVLLCCFRTIPTRQAMNIQVFGRYAGTRRREGLLWKFPLLVSTHHLSLALETTETPTLKVNDAAGSPIEIGAVAFWHVEDAARAQFAIEEPKTFVAKRLEAALRAVAAEIPYEAEEGRPSLRSGGAAVAERIRQRFADDLAQGGLAVDDVQIAHLAYAPEIAAAMLRRQQAQAVVEARRQIVDGAVSIVQHALEGLERDAKTPMTGDQKARLAGDLLIVLTSESGAQPTLPLGRG